MLFSSTQIFLFSFTPLTAKNWKIPWKHCWVNKEENRNHCKSHEVTIIESKPVCCVSYLVTGCRKTLGSQQFVKSSDASSRYFLLCTLVSIHISLFRLRVREWKNGRNERINNPNENFIDICDVHRNKNGKTLVVEMKMFFFGIFHKLREFLEF